MVSLGCPKNLVDSDVLSERLREEGFIHVSAAGQADFVLVNTCGFIEEARKESVEEILKLARERRKGGKLLVFGCFAKRYGATLMREIPEIDGLWGLGEEDKILEYCKQTKYEVESLESGYEADDERVSFCAKPYIPNFSSFAYLKVAEGCNRGCTYCVIPSIRGSFRSIAPEKILRKAEEHLNSGVRELVLVAQDLGTYGSEFGGYTLTSLVRDICSLAGNFWVRLLYVNPSSVSDDLLKMIADEHKVCKYLDVPLQHSEDRMLKAMGRGGTRRSVTKTINKIREAVPDVVLRTTFIVGFPGETEDDFLGLKDFVLDTGFEHLGVFTYSKEEGTPAAKMKGHVPKKTKERRRNEIMRIQSRISLEKNRALLGRNFRALVDEAEDGVAVGRLFSQAPEIDGVVFIENVEARMNENRGDSVNKSSSLQNSRGFGLSAGEFVEVEVVEAYDYDLKGRPIP